MTVLAVGSHPDDIEIGCGGTLAIHRKAGERVIMLILTDGQRGPGGVLNGPCRRAEQQQASHILDCELMWGGLMDCDVSDDRDTVNIIEEAIRATGADTLYCPWPNDSHQDHRATSAAAISAARKLGRILYYGGPTSLSFNPTIRVDIAATIQTKLAAIEAHQTQVTKALLVDPEAVLATARVEGLAARTHYAEGFTPLRLLLDPTLHAKAYPPDERRQTERRTTRRRAKTPPPEDTKPA